jgi:hypothetical protein
MQLSANPLFYMPRRATISAVGFDVAACQDSGLIQANHRPRKLFYGPSSACLEGSDVA